MALASGCPFPCPDSLFSSLFYLCLTWCNGLSTSFENSCVGTLLPQCSSVGRWSEWKVLRSRSGVLVNGFMCFLCVWYQSLNSGPIPWATPPALFVLGIFEIGSHEFICPVWLRTAILLISASWVARITGVSHWCLTSCASCGNEWAMEGVQLLSFCHLEPTCHWTSAM
jgi:hypothetical protein